MRSLMSAAGAAADEFVLPPVTVDGVLLGAGVVAGGWLFARVTGWVTRRVLLWRGRSNSASDMFAHLMRWFALLVAWAAALTIVFPSIKPVNALGGIGVLSIAAGIAFQTVLGNMSAGIVILARDKFRVNDEIAVQDVAGPVPAVPLTSTSVPDLRRPARPHPN